MTEIDHTPSGVDPGLAARQGAHAIVDAVLTRSRTLDDAFAEAATRGLLARLEAPDRGFARAIAMMTLRHLGEIDLIIKRLLQRPLPRRAGPTQVILRTAIAEILFLDVKAHAAVDLAVEAAGRDGEALHFKSLVNASLRRLLRERDTLRDGIDGERAALPAWLWKSWLGIYGEIKTRAIIRAQFIEPQLDLSVKNPDDIHLWAEKLGARVLPTGSLRLAASGRVEAMPGFAEGAWWVQDAAAALPARLLGEVKNRDVLDLCAAPGGKTAWLASRGAHVTALDRSAQRLLRLTENLQRLGLAAETVTTDAATYEPGRLWPLILLDAPCTATGTARRHPDVLRLKKPADRDRLAQLQARLLERAAELLEPGGTLIFTTCSLEPEEGIRQIEQFLAAHANFARAPIASSEIGGLDEAITPLGDLRSLPCHMADEGGLDGFYAARLVRRL